MPGACQSVGFTKHFLIRFLVRCKADPSPTSSVPLPDTPPAGHHCSVVAAAAVALPLAGGRPRLDFEKKERNKKKQL